MTDPPPSKQRVQRTRLGTRLRQLRMLAGLSGRELAQRIGISQATVSRIENAHSVPSLPQVDAWAEATSASAEARDELVMLTESALNEVIALTEEALDEVQRWRARQQQAGLPAMQADVRMLEASTRTKRHFQSSLVPGLLQTAEYARRVFALTDVLGEGGYGQAVAARLERQEALYDEARRFEFVLTEAALRWRPGSAAMLAIQLDRLASLATLQSVSLGVIPAGARIRTVPWCGFVLHEDREDNEPFVTLELPHAGLTVTEPSDVEIYRKEFELLRESAVFDDEARELLERISREVRGLRED